MRIDISYKNITPDKPLEVFIEEKIGGLERYINDGPIFAKVEMGLPSRHHRSGPVFYAEVNLSIGSKLLRANCQHEDLRNAIVDAKNELRRQIKDFKEKKKDLTRRAK